MTAIVDEYIESPLDNDDVFPCKGCGEVCALGPSLPPPNCSRTVSQRSVGSPILTNASCGVDSGGRQGLRVRYVCHAI